jgi:hypothetical protein
MLPFTCAAFRDGQPPQRIGIIARSKDDAILTAQELFPDCTLGVMALEPDWTDDQPHYIK